MDGEGRGTGGIGGGGIAWEVPRHTWPSWDWGRRGRGGGGRGGGRAEGWNVVEAHAGDGGGGQWDLEGVPIEMTDVAAGATVEPVEVLIIPKCRGDIGDDESKTGPEENDGETVDALGKEEVDE